MVMSSLPLGQKFDHFSMKEEIRQCNLTMTLIAQT